MLCEIIEAEHIIEGADRADRLELLAELALLEVGKAVAAEIAGGAGAAGGDDGHAVGAAAIVPLRRIDAAPGGDRAQRDSRRGIPGDVEGVAVAAVDARLLRHADIRGAHARIAID